MNFFDSACQIGPVSHMLFGICDDQTGGKAYITALHTQSWVATVKNGNLRNITFTAIDKCVIKDDEEKGRSRCDGMLTTTGDRELFLIELKDQIPPWMPHAFAQLESTIQFLLASHDIERFKIRKAFACNKKRPTFQVIDHELKKRFYDTYRFRLDVQSEIVFD